MRDLRKESMKSRGRFAAILSWLVVCLTLISMPAVVRAQTEKVDAATTEYRMENFGVGDEVYVRALAIDHGRGALWVGTSVGAMEIDLASFDLRQVFTREQGLANEYVFAIGIDPRGPIWFGTNAGGTSTYSDGEWRTYFPMHGLADYWVYAFAFDDAGAWIGTWNGANWYSNDTQAFTTYRDELVNIWVYGIAIDDEGKVWFGTEGGVSMFDKGEWHSWTHEDGLGAANTNDLPLSSNTGLGTQTRHDLSVTVDGGPSYNPDYVFSALWDRRRGGVWFGTWGGGASHFDGDKTWLSYSRADGLAGDIVYSMAQAQDGTLWFGTDRGISRFDGENWTTFSHGLVNRHIYAIVVGDDGTVWAGTKGAVTKLSPE